MGATIYATKYVHDESRLNGYKSAGPFTRTQVENAGFGHLLAHNDADEWRVTLAWGGGNAAWDALNEIHANYHDTETLADHDTDVKSVLNDRFGERDDWIDIYTPPDSENTA